MFSAGIWISIKHVIVFLFDGDDAHPKIKLRALIYDADASLGAVTIWHSAVRDIFQIDTSTLLDAWSVCDTEEDVPELFLFLLNEHCDVEFIFMCSASVWRYGHNDQHAQVQINVNGASKKDLH